MFDRLRPWSSSAWSPALLLQVLLACFRTIISVTRVYIYCRVPVIVVVLASFSPAQLLAYTNCVLAEGLHFSAFHFMGRWSLSKIGVGVIFYSYGVKCLANIMNHMSGTYKTLNDLSYPFIILFIC